MPKAYILIGIPGSGKSTWANTRTWSKDCVYVSTDKFVEAYAREIGKTYSEVFDEIMPKAVELMANEVKEARNAGKDIIWDQTSTTVKSRTRKFNMLPDYEMIAVVFSTPGEEELSKRLANRPGKQIPKNVIDDMIANFEKPSSEEGFQNIIYVGRQEWVTSNNSTSETL
jgi:predicted kinase